MPHRTPRRPAFALVIFLVEPPAGIEPATPSLPWNHQQPLCEPPFPQVTPDRQGQSYGFSLGAVMCSPDACHEVRARLIIVHRPSATTELMASSTWHRCSESYRRIGISTAGLPSQLVR